MNTEIDNRILDVFLKKQLQLFPRKVADTREEAEEFLEECMAVVANSPREVKEYFEEEVIDTEGATGTELLEAAEVFDIGDGRYLIVEA